ncbi:hypothetical protein Taro_024422, partial [Colocasia esculenta]|nr:hypothetical protein [Colocasia esculenta]
MVACWPHSSEEVVGRSRWLASRGSGRCVLLLVASGGGLVAVMRSEVAMLVVTLWSHMVAPVFRELF